MFHCRNTKWNLKPQQRQSLPPQVGGALPVSGLFRNLINAACSESVPNIRRRHKGVTAERKLHHHHHHHQHDHNRQRNEDQKTRVTGQREKLGPFISKKEDWNEGKEQNGFQHFSSINTATTNIKIQQVH